MTSSNTDSIHSSTPLALGLRNIMPSQSNKPQRPTPGHVQTNFSAQRHAMAPPSAVSASSRASNSQHGSPIMSIKSPESTILTPHSSMQASPESMRPQFDDSVPSVFQLPEALVSPKPSMNSFIQSCTGSPSTTHESIFSNNSFEAPTATASTTTLPITNNAWTGSSSAACESVLSNHNLVTPTTTVSTTTPPTTSNTVPAASKSIIRRLSSRASKFSNRRRQSSAAPSSRESSVGPYLWRMRSDSNATAPEFSVALTDSESDMDDERSIRNPLFDGTGDSPISSTAASISSGSNTMSGPCIPTELQPGTWLRKISKKNRVKVVLLTYDPETNKLLWDRNRPNKFLHVDEINEIRTESDIQQYARDFGISDKERERLFSISYVVPDKSKKKFLHLIADNVETYKRWTKFLGDMLKHRQEVMTSLMTFNERAIFQYWQSEMQKHSSEDQGELDINGVKRMCQDLHIWSSQSTIQSNFRLALRRGEKLNYPEFLEFVRLMRQRQDVHRLMQSIAEKPEDGLTLNEFLEFLQTVQKEDITKRAPWERIFNKYVHKHRNDDASAEVKAEDLSFMSETAFIGFLNSRQNLPTVDEQQEFTLDRPMNEYFISSSHNTYLLGRQVAGQSSIEGYISTLMRGCRCVEVDCWDGGDGQPLVVHGRTLTSSISFKEVMTTIQKYAFTKSKFPLWISLEVHCNPAQQAIMARIIKDTFLAQLVTEPLDPNSDKLPSPSELMERVLIKVKQPRAVKEDSAGGDILNARRRGNSLSSAFSRPANPDITTFSTSQSLPQSPLLIPSNPTRKPVGKSRGNTVDTIAEGEVQELQTNNNSDSDSGSDLGSFKGSNNIIPVLGKLGVYCAGLKFSGFDAPAAKKFNHIFSFMESSFAKNSRTKDEKTQLNIHNMRYLMRVYPDGSRLNSSNFDPLSYWRRGVQMAALNWQTFDMGMQVNRAMFEGGTDSSGYVLKPQELRDIQVLPNDEAINEAIAQGKKERSVVSFSIDVISAQQLMRPANLAANKSMDFYVDVDVFHANDKRNKKDKDFELSHEPDSPLLRHTEVVRENGFNPMFSNGQFRFKVTTKHPELIFVRWSVRLSSDGENYSTKEKPAMASYTAKLTNLKHGYRTLPLLNHAGEQYLFSSLFCKIEVDAIEKKFIDVPRTFPDGGSKFNLLNSRVFGRNSNSSPRSTIEKGSAEKRSFESY